MTIETEQQPTEEQEQATPEEQAQEAAPEAQEGAEAEAAPAEGEGEASEETPEQAEEAAEKEKHKRAGGWQRKIERLEREKELLLEQLTAQRGGKQPEKPSKELSPDEAAAEYVNQLVEQRLAAKEAERQQQQVQAEFVRRTAEVRAAHPDFDEVVQSADVPVSQAVTEALLTSEHGPAIMYQLAKSPAELARINALPPLRAAMEIARLEAKASVTAPPKTAPKPASRKPSAPAPIVPVTARGPSSVKPVSEMSYEEYTAWRESQSKR